jgi:uncharacterized membrane protein YqjE
VTAAPQSHEQGLFGSARRAGLAMIQLLDTRLEILSTEVAEERMHLMRLMVAGLVVLFALQAGLLFSLLYLVLLFGPEHRLTTIGTAALVLLLGGFAGGLWMRAWLKRRPPIFMTSISELRKDAERLGGDGRRP